MLRNKGIIVVLLVAIFSLDACVAPPPRQTVVYRERSDQSPDSGRNCQTCGTVRDVAQVQLQQQNTGGGAVLGAIIGGLIGSQFGHGSGQAAATAAGFLGGAAVGNAVESDSARAASGYVWRFRVELDDGRWATVTQHDNPGFHPGARVFIRGDHLETLQN